jgi:ABC-type multidrug transport system ATPase subunit
MIELSHLTFSYGKNKPTILSDVSLIAKDGECTVLCGENGAGKSTLVGLLAEILKPTDGTVHHTGRLGYLPQESALFDDMSARDNLKFFARLYGVPLPKDSELPFGVADFLNKKAGELSGGMKKRLSLACTLIGSPDTLLLDEPSAALDSEHRQQLIQLLLTLRNEGKCILYIGHDEKEYREICNARYLLDKKKIIPYPIVE